MVLTEKIAGILKNAGIENFIQESRWIAKESPDADTALSRARQRAAGVPLQYLLGTAPFRFLMLKVDSRVLIPRPETETLAQWIIDHAPHGGTVLDLGCGSGAIALAVASERPDLEVTAVDISHDALALAKENAALCAVRNVTFIQSSLFDSLPKQRFDFIAANLPYVTEEEYLQLPDEVRLYEPKLALTAPDDGLALILAAIAALPDHLNPGGGAIFELSPEQATRTARAITAAGMLPGILPDLCGRDRFVTGLLPK